ncbi:MAG: hypothetical protein QE285_18165 [Aquabacterium sp.]|nr:hypothetical protein [Aquabacterium sp.]
MVIPSRRDAIGLLAWPGGLLATAGPSQAQAAALLTKPIPRAGEVLPVVGLGSWITFNVGTDRAGRDAGVQVVQVLCDEGGRRIDSSPMYGPSQRVIGEALARLQHPRALASAEKVWTGDGGTKPLRDERSALRLPCRPTRRGVAVLARA